MQQGFQGFRPGDIVDDRYEIIDIIGQGGFGVVYRARQIAIDRVVALKILLPEADTIDPQAVERFRREAVLISSLESPNTITLIEFGQTDAGLLYTVMEFARGETLRQLLARESKLNATRTVHICKQVLASLNEAHTRGIVHRDLKPANIMVGEYAGVNDHVKVLDFGIAKILKAGDTQSTLALTGRIVGTPRYMAPEQLRGATPTPAADLYAMGLIMVEMLTGDPCVKPNDPMEQVELQMRDESFKLPHLPGLPLDLVTVVNRALEKDPKKRFQTADVFAKALEGSLRGGQMPVDPNVTRMAPRVIPADLGPQRGGGGDEEEEEGASLTPYIIIATLLFLVAAAGVGYVVFVQKGPGTDVIDSGVANLSDVGVIPIPDVGYADLGIPDLGITMPDLGVMPVDLDAAMGMFDALDVTIPDVSALLDVPMLDVAGLEDALAMVQDMGVVIPDAGNLTPSDAGTPDATATADTGAADTSAATDTAPADTGVATADTAPADTGPADTGVTATDTGPADTAVATADTEPADTGAADTTPPPADAGPPDAVALADTAAPVEDVAAPPADAGATATVPLEITSTPSARVYMPDQEDPVCENTPCTIQVPADGSSIQVTLRRRGYDRLRREVSSDNAPTVNFRLRESEEETPDTGIAPI